MIHVRTGKSARATAVRCCSCAGCVAVCPENAMRMDNLTLLIDPEQCTGCGRCILFCPTEALTLEPQG